MKYYRLKQPLLGNTWPNLEDAKKLRDLIVTYDAIFNLIFPPGDMSARDIQANAKTLLEFFGSKLEQALGSDIFEVEEETQLSFDLEGDKSGKV